ncbi:MAG: protein kinase [Acidobacteriota bacterium]|nr:protein kinase [Acidobacteriota bacterium]
MLETIASETHLITRSSAGAERRSGLGLDRSPALIPGTDFGPRYFIESVLGEGGMGKVYRAHDRELNRKVALKLIRPELAADPRSLERLKQELLLASSISHKNILRIHDLGETQGVKFISMAYIEGNDLHDVLKETGKLPLDRALRIARQLAGALEAAHAENVVHRDLKPRNILVDKSDQIYVADFGLAKSLEPPGMEVSRTGVLVGTPLYMAPEQVEGKPVDNRTDLYAFGLVLYEMVTGDVPFPDVSSLGTMNKRIHEAPKNPQLLNPDVPDHLAKIILRCLEKVPSQRYQSAGEILSDLRTESVASDAGGHPVSRRPVWPWIAVAAFMAVSIALLVPAIRRAIAPFAPTGSNTLTAVPSAAKGKFVAVLPLRVLGDQEWLKYMAEGVVESLSAKLFQSKTVHLASPSLVEKVNRTEPLQKIARDLGVNLLVQGSIRGEGEKILMVMSLEDMNSGQRVWSEEFSGLRQDVMTIEDQVYGKLVRNLEQKPSNEELARGSMHPTENLEAYDLYLKARSALRAQKASTDVKGIDAALNLYNQAIQKDANFALAYAGLADAYLYMYDAKKDSYWTDKALAAAKQARRLNPNLPEVHFSLGSVYIKTGKAAEAVAELQHALQLAPNSDEGQRRLGGAYLYAGRKAEAFDAYQKAIQTNPYYWVNYNQLGVAFLQSGQNEGALNAFRRVTEIEPDRSAGYNGLGVVYFRQGKWKECVQAFAKAVALQPSFRSYSNLGGAYIMLGKYNEAVTVLEKAITMNPNDIEAAGSLADAYRGLGQQNKANLSYDRAIALGFKALEVNPRDAATLGNIAVYYAKKNDRERALEFIHRARSIDSSQANLIYDEVVVHAFTGKPAEAIAMLRQAFEKGYSSNEANSDPDLKNLRVLPEFNKLVRDYSRKSAK